ncbi:MAG: Smr/MutS family protein [Chitinophagaceae bacterium]|nr:Smr/MutS family protein [Oligoflexus sp.]
MGKSKGRNKTNQNNLVPPTPVRFELEENALELMESHLALFKPRAKDADTNARQERESVKKQKAKQRGSNVIQEIDLHGLTLEQAEREVAEAITRRSSLNEKRTFKIITGKGRHSSSGRGVLIREIYLFVVHRYGPWIEQIEESPDGVRLGGEAIRGHFHVTLKGP